jgi:hypothetical protein
MLFPRVWDGNNDRGQSRFYQEWLGLADKEKPGFGDNLQFFFEYQINWMYWRYFMWNFAGKQNDIQGMAPGNVRDGNWISGIGFMDDIRLGKQSAMPDSIKNNKANNKLYFLPFILGLLGIYFHYTKHKKDFLVSFLLFFFTGFAIVLYLNQAGNQPRERDYAYVGSFYAFSIWIGLGMLQVKEWLRKFTSENIANIAGFAVCMLAVPILMAQQEWDDHDRSKKVLARDIAKDYLESCAPNSILFTYGDNDTYPLWYAQEVEGIRPDIRVINNSLLGIDWYINQLRYKVNESDPIDVIWSAEQIRGEKRNYLFVNPRKELGNAYMDLYDVMKNFAGSDDPAAKVPLQNGESINYLPGRNYKIPVDEKLVRENKTVNSNDSVPTEMLITLPESARGIAKNDLAILNIIAANKWKRPIYFTAPNTAKELGFDNYMRRDGLTYRLVPVKNNNGVNTNWMAERMADPKKFAFGNANIKGVYFDEQNRQNLITLRQTYATAATALVGENRKEEARKLLNIADKNIDEANVPYAMVSSDNRHNYFSLLFLEACYAADDTQKADKISKALHKDFEDQKKYYAALGKMTVSELDKMVEETMRTQREPDLRGRQLGMQQEILGTYQILNMLNGIDARYKKGSQLNVNPEGSTAPVITPDSSPQRPK